MYEEAISHEICVESKKLAKLSAIRNFIARHPQSLET